MTEKDSGQEDHSKLQLSRRRALQLSSGAAVGGTVFGEGARETSASSENGEDDSERDDDEVGIHGPSDQQIDGPTEVIKGVPETYSVNRADHLDFAWSAENGTVDEDRPEVEITFHSTGEQEVRVMVAEDGVPDAVGHLDVSVNEIEVDGPDETAVGQDYTFVVPDEPAGVDLGDWSVTPDDAGSFVTEANRVGEVEFEEEASPATIELEYETDSGHTGTATHEVEVKQIELHIEDARLVQTVGYTRVEDGNGKVQWDDEPDPDLLKDRNVSVGFNLDGEHIDLLENDITVVVERNRQWQNTSGMGTRSVFEDEFELQESRFGSRNDIERFVDAAHGIEELHTLANEYDVGVPVFPLDLSFAELSSVELRIESDVVDSDPVTIERGTDFEVAEPRTLRVGFIGLKDPDGGTNYGEGTGGLPFSGEEWHSRYKENVENAIELLEMVYPVDNVVPYRHDELMEGSTGILSDITDRSRRSLYRDAIRARDTLEEQTAISESETVNGNGEITEFDATVLVVPFGYFEFHTGSDTTVGMALQDSDGDRQPQAACLVQDTAVENTTTPHEVCHLVTQELYEGPGDHPMAKRDSWDGDEWDLDFEHARGVDDEDGGQDDPIGVRSAKFDLTDGEYHVEPAMPSFMGYDSGDEWIDSRMFQYLIEHGFEPSPPEDEDWGWLLTASTDAQRIEVISGTATIEDDGSATVDYAHRRDGYPMPQDGDGNVTLTLQSADGEPLGTVTTVDEWVGLAEESFPIPDTVPFVVPYPEELDTLVFEREGMTSTIDPRGSLLASAKDRIDEESFIKDPEDRLPSLQDKLESVDGQLQNSAYKAAYNKLTNDIRPRVEEWLHDDATVPANYYTKSELLELIDDVIARLEALYDVHDDLPGCGPPDDHPGQGPPEDHPGRGPPEDTPGRGPPDEPPGCDPSDDEPGRGPPDDDDDPGRGPPDDDDDDPPGDGPPGDDPPGGGPPDDDDDRGNRNDNSGASTVMDGLKSLNFDSVSRYWPRFR